jgi:hypothetical protein
MDQPRQTAPASIDPEIQQAVARVGYTPEAHARWLIALGSQQHNIDQLSTAELRALGSEMAVFCEEPQDRFSEDRVRHWLFRIRKGVQQLAEGRAWSHGLVTHANFWVPRPGQQAGSLPSHWFGGEDMELVEPKGQIEPKAPHVLHHSVTRKDLMAHRICETLAAVGERLRRCHRKGCARLFIRRKRQLYCTPACGWLTRTHKHRAKQRRAAARRAKVKTRLLPGNTRGNGKTARNGGQR